MIVESPYRTLRVLDDPGRVFVPDQHPFEPFKQWVWTNTNRHNARVVLEVNLPGVHTVNVWMREDGFLLDRLLLARDPAYKPDGEGVDLTPQRHAR